MLLLLAMALFGLLRNANSHLFRSEGFTLFRTLIFTSYISIIKLNASVTKDDARVVRFAAENGARYGKVFKKQLYHLIDKCPLYLYSKIIFFIQ